MNNKAALKITNTLLKTLNRELVEMALNTKQTIPALMANLETAKLEQMEDGTFAITRYNDISRYASSRADRNIRLWYNSVSSKKYLKDTIYCFVSECLEDQAILINGVKLI